MKIYDEKSDIKKKIYQRVIVISEKVQNGEL